MGHLVSPREVNIAGFSFKDDHGVLRPQEYHEMNLLKIRDYLMRQPIISKSLKDIAPAVPYLLIYCTPGSAILEQRNRPILISGLLAVWLIDEAINVRQYTEQLHSEVIDFSRVMVPECDLGYQSTTQMRFRVVIRPPALQLYVLPSFATLISLYTRWETWFRYPLSGVSFINDRILFELKEIPEHDFRTALLSFPSGFSHCHVKLRYLNGPLFDLENTHHVPGYYTGRGWNIGEATIPIPFRRDKRLKTLLHSNKLEYQTRYLLGPENSVYGYDELVCQGFRVSLNSGTWNTKAIWTKDMLCNLDDRHRHSHYIPIWSKDGKVAGIFDFLWHRNHPSRESNLLLGADVMDPIIEGLVTETRTRIEKAREEARIRNLVGWRKEISAGEEKVKTRMRRMVPVDIK